MPKHAVIVVERKTRLKAESHGKGGGIRAESAHDGMEIVLHLPRGGLRPRLPGGNDASAYQGSSIIGFAEYQKRSTTPEPQI
ncbi:MAG: hypothetical protein PVJ44_22465 [Desulfobacterales bacterium]|jgi:hypothetical protein